MITVEQVRIGLRVISNVAFSDVPAGTEGVIDELYGTGCMVAWDLPEHPLPEGYIYTGEPMLKTGILRDGFGYEFDLQFLDIAGP